MITQLTLIKDVLADARVDAVVGIERRLDMYASLDRAEDLVEQSEPAFLITWVACAELRDTALLLNSHLRELRVVAVVLIAGQHLLSLAAFHAQHCSGAAEQAARSLFTVIVGIPRSSERLFF